jgi:hypothetical protein
MNMANTLPNLPLLKELYETYYGAEVNADKESASSHWQHYGGLFDVEIDSEGMPSKMHGVGFGHAQWGNQIHRLLDQACALSYLLHLQDRGEIISLWRKVIGLCRKMGLDPTFDGAFRQVCVLVQLKRHIGVQISDENLTVLLIGDGFGVLSSLFKEEFPNSTLVLVDLGKTLFFQGYYCQMAHPQCRHLQVCDEALLEGADFVYCPADALESLEPARFDLAINVCSMQEMGYASIEGYFSLMRRTMRAENLFYCCNRERKVLPGGEVIELAAYPWSNRDVVLIDELCPWHNYTFIWGRPEKGPRVLGWRLPFIGYYDGTISHRLVKMAI